MTAKNSHRNNPPSPSSSAKPSSKAPAAAVKNPSNPSAVTPINLDSSPPITLSEQDLYLSSASRLSRDEVLKRRSHNLKQLSRCYRDHYWALMEELKFRHREYYWKFGVSPIKDHEALYNQDNAGGLERENGCKREGGGDCNNVGNIGENNNYGELGNRRCLFHGCKTKAMALVSFCHLHILSDSKQKLYKPCCCLIESASAGPKICGRPTLSSVIPPLCSVHFQKAQKHVTQALKREGLNISSSSNKLAPKLHVIIPEYVYQIQTKRRAARKGHEGGVVDKEKSGS